MPENFLDLAECPIPVLLDNIKVSARLKNALLAQYDTNTLPFRSIREFKELREYEIILNQIPNIGKNSILEFKRILDQVEKKQIINTKENTLVINKLKKLTIKQFIVTYDDEFNLFNDILLLIYSTSFPYKYVYELEQLSVAELTNLLSNANTNSETLDKFLALLDITFNSSSLLSQNLQPQKYFNILLKAVLNVRDAFVLSERLGVLDGESKTLELIGKKISVTRERVRQIEKKSVVKINEALKSEGINGIKQLYSNQINEQLFGENTFISLSVASSIFKHLPSWLRIFINCHDKSIAKYLSSSYVFSSEYNGWFINNDALSHAPIFNNCTSCTLKEAISKSTWPIRIKQLSSLMGIPTPIVIDDIKKHPNRYSIINNANHLSIKNVTKKDAIRYILRRYKHAMKLDEVATAYKQMFGKNISISATNNTLGSMPDALIVNRGTYNLYENINLTDKNILDIKSIVMNILMDHQSYISSKIIYKRLQENIEHDFMKHLNGYSILGILQDDSIFDCKRGLMVGLNDPNFSGTFKGLTDEVQELIKYHDRPLLINEIINMLSETRELIYPSVQTLLKSNKEFEETASGAYTVTDHQHHETNLSDKLDVNALFSDW